MQNIANKMDKSTIVTKYVDGTGSTTMPDGTYIVFVCKAQYGNATIWIVQSTDYTPYRLGGNTSATMTVTKSDDTLTFTSEYGNWCNWMFIKV